MIQPGAPEWAAALGLVPSGLFAMTAAFDGERTAVLVSWVQQCGFEPPLIAVASPRGRPIAPLIRDSHAFALCLVDPKDRFLVRTIQRAEESPDDALDALDCETLMTGSPCLKRSTAAIDCEVMRHLDLESDHELYVGMVVGTRIYDEGLEPAPCARASGLLQD